MRVLWFCNTSSLYLSEDASRKGYNGGGWVSSLEKEISPRVELGVCFTVKDPSLMPEDGSVATFGKVSLGRSLRHSVMYYPVLDGYDMGRGDRVRSLLFGDGKRERMLEDAFTSVVEDFAPDVIQVFGSEHSFGMVAGRTSVPVILHIQGILNPYYEVFLPKWTSWREYILTPLRIGEAFGKLYTRVRWKRACEREKKIIPLIENYIGRTDWDREQTKSLKGGPISYYYGGEILRDVFYSSRKWSGGEGGLKIVSTISEPPYKGLDVIMKAGKLLKEKGVEFRWEVYGNVSGEFFSRKLGLGIEECGLTLMGVAGEEELCRALLSCTFYVHPSYIDNSPNSVAEAQILGVPVIASRVGGVPSMVEDGVTGLLFTAGDSGELVDRILSSLSKEKETPGYLLSLGLEGRAVALSRHDRDSIARGLLDIYSSVIGTGK